jgi:hypothetical protein
MDQQFNADVIERGDLDALTDRIDSLCFDANWAMVVDLRDGCRAALERGKQLWPAAAYAEYRLALDAPGAFAGAVAESPAQRFSFGPFAEVMASTHTFAELSDHLPPGPTRGSVAQERVARGEDLSALDWLRAEDPFGLPLALMPFESGYSRPVYEPSKCIDDAPDLPAFSAMMRAEPGERLGELDGLDGLGDFAEVIDSLRELGSTWTSQSNGRIEAVVVDGGASEAVAALGCRSHRLAVITLPEALGWMAWTAASGGAHGRRSGMAAGRHAALWAMLNVCGLADSALEIRDHPLEEFSDVLAELEFGLFDDGSPPNGWNLRLTITDPYDGISFAVSATDARME